MFPKVPRREEKKAEGLQKDKGDLAVQGCVLSKVH